MKLTTGCMTFAWVGLVFTAELWAKLPQPPGEITPDNRPAGWVAWIVSTILVAGVVVVSIKNSKRSHLD